MFDLLAHFRFAMPSGFVQNARKVENSKKPERVLTQSF